MSLSCVPRVLPYLIRKEQWPKDIMFPPHSSQDFLRSLMSQGGFFCAQAKRHSFRQPGLQPGSLLGLSSLLQSISDLPHDWLNFLPTSLPSLMLCGGLCGNTQKIFVDLLRSHGYFLETSTGKVQFFLGTKTIVTCGFHLPSEVTSRDQVRQS